MAKILKSFNWELFEKPMSKHRKWLDGNIWEIKQGVDYKNPNTIYILKQLAKRKNIQLKYSKPDKNTFVIQAVTTKNCIKTWHSNMRGQT